MSRKRRKDRITDISTEAHDAQVSDDNITVRDKDGVWRQSDQLMYGYDEEADE